jgi:low temperature requirement protein LtrA
LVQMFILAMLGLTIEPWLDVMGDRFFGLYGFSKLLLAGLYLRWRDASHPDAIKRIDNKNLVGNVLAFVLALIGIFVTPVWSLLFFILALSIDILLPLTVSHTWSKWSLVHLEKFAERFGLFIIIVLGESIVGVIGGSAGSEYISREMIIMIIGAVLLSFGHRWMYFDFVGRSALKPATMYSRAYLHIPLVVCYTLIGAALLMIVSHASHPPEHAIALLTAWVLGVILLITALERLVGNHVHGYRVDRGSSLQLLLSGIGIVIVWVLPLSIIVHLWLVTALIFVPIVARLLWWLRTPLQKTDPDPLTTPPIGNNGVVSPDSLGEIDMRSQPK